jgi:hypothetical protein
VRRGPGIGLGSFIYDEARGEGQPARAINGRWNAASMRQVKASVIGKEKWGDANLRLIEYENVIDEDYKKFIQVFH